MIKSIREFPPLVIPRFLRLIEELEIVEAIPDVHTEVVVIGDEEKRIDECWGLVMGDSGFDCCD